MYLLGQQVNVQVYTRHHYQGVKLFINSCYAATANTLSQASKHSIIDNYGWVEQNTDFVEHLLDTNKHCPTHVQVFTGKPDKSRCFKIQVLQGRQCCSVLLWCFPVHWRCRCPGVFVYLILFSLLTYLWRQNCTVCCDALIQYVIHHVLCVIYCRSHSIVSSLFLVVALVQCRSLVFTATPLKG